MRLKNILNENYGQTPNMLTFRDLASNQVAVLIKLSKGGLSSETASPRELAVLDSLRDLNLVTDYDELTDSGQKAAELGMKYGSFERRNAAKRDSELNRNGGSSEVDLDFDDSGAEEIDLEVDSPRHSNW